MSKQHIVIIGAGLGGLSSAIVLQSRGYQVTCLEKNDEPGGKLHEVKLGSASFDFGPNTITMPHVFQDVLKGAGLNPDEYFTFTKLQKHTTNAFPDGTSFSFSSNMEEMQEELFQLDPGAADRYPAYLKEAERLYKLAENHFFNRTFSGFRDYFSFGLARALAASKPVQTMDAFHQRFFSDERIRAAFNRYATYIGSSPFDCPATFSLIGYLELADGVYYTNGGNYKIALGMKRAASDLGVAFHFGEEVTNLEIVNRNVQNVHTKKRMLQADAVIMNGDLLTQFPALVSEDKRPSFSDKKAASFEPSISAAVVLSATDTAFPTNHHHVFFSGDPEKEFRQIFQDKQYGDDPTVYLCTSSRTDHSRSSDGDNVFLLVNAPAVSSKKSEFPIERIYRKLSAYGIDLRHHTTEHQVILPEHIQDSFYAFRGALYGLSANSRKNTFLRPYNQAADISNLYFAGGSTHPGGGSPMVTISGVRTAELLMKQQR
ncbi:phytoene desaturase family protein [Alkalicoccus luteus]|uniref:4,4'-diaponeurosporene oxygenase n=1 Tax=Alkalicoccus luteus TaxID=1237094 RepID=A0A969PT14_9BACI|nr:phytoene desaturase family protein [Alkalicoccus luteus]NJP38818.1 phytoene desaturase [Alkalicoccus luteus]